MTNQHPIVPPQALIKSWEDQIIDADFGSEVEEALIEVYRAGADHELEACCEWLESVYGAYDWSTELHTTRRPDPPSLKEQAYEALDTYVYGSPNEEDKVSTYNIIRRALEALPE